ncbi:MAG: hypothetical protein NT154_40370 [Verrucomicrobia bacterium]|nr:hypothetical protein [Verrucomicrobiota bacterium]
MGILHGEFFPTNSTARAGAWLAAPTLPDQRGTQIEANSRRGPRLPLFAVRLCAWSAGKLFITIIFYTFTVMT